jgi:hypothetical protein
MFSQQISNRLQNISVDIVTETQAKNSLIDRPCGTTMRAAPVDKSSQSVFGAAQVWSDYLTYV